MAKREAEEQMTKDGTFTGASGNDKLVPSFASSDVLAKRKILKPKGKSFNLQTSNSNNNSNSNSNSAFSGFTSSSSESSGKDAKLKALGISFSNSVKKVKVDEGVADFRPLVNIYLKYYQDIENGLVPKPSQVTAGSEITQKNDLTPHMPLQKLPTKESNSRKNIACESDNDDDDDDDEEKKEIKIQGPQFNLTSKPTIKNSPFTFGKKPVPKKVDSDSDSEIEIKGPTFTFSKQIKDPVFTLSGDANNGAVTSPVNPNTKNSNPFTFGTNKAADKAENDEHPNSTGTALVSTQETSDKAPSLFSKPQSFTFDQKNSTTENPVDSAQNSGFKFQGGLFGQNSNPAFQKPQNENGKPQFSFNSVTSSSSGETSKATFQFTSKLSEKSSEIAPAFNLGGSASNTFNSTTGSQNNESHAAGFGESKPSEGEKKLQNDSHYESDGGAEPKFKPVAALNDKAIDSKTGEESEKVLYQCRTKVMLFNPKEKANPYKTLGKGDLKVLQQEDKGSSRLLVRADGGLRVILNVSLAAKLTYSTLDNGSLVRVPVPNTEGTIDTYVLKVKTADDGQKLCEILNNTTSR